MIKKIRGTEMKRFITILAILLFGCFPGLVLADGSYTAMPTPVKDIRQNLVGGIVTITSTADASSGAYLPVLFDRSNNDGCYGIMIGRWLTTAITYPAKFSSSGLWQPAPTANYDIYIIEKVYGSPVSSTSDFVLTSPTLAIGSDTSAVSTVAFTYVINGVSYSKVAVAAGTEPGNDVIVATKYGAVAFDIGADGTIDVIEATNQAAEQFTSAALAAAALPVCASDHVRLGHITATKSDGSFTLGTTALNAVNATVVYTSAIPAFDIMGGQLTNRSATDKEEVYPINSAGDNKYHFLKGPIMVVPVNNSVNSAVFNLELTFN